MVVWSGKNIKMKNKKLTIKDMFIDESELNNLEESIIVQPKNRMVELIKSFESPNEIIKEDKQKPVDEKKIEQERERLKQITLNESNQLNYWAGNAPTILGKGQTINTAFNQQNQNATINTTFGNQNNTNIGFSPNANGPHNPNYTYLQPSEAVRLAISRTLNSGAPVNNIGFYEEVNRELNILGFNSKSPLDIKQTLLKLIQD